MHSLGKKPETDGKQFFHGANLLPIQQEENDVVVRLDDDVAMRNVDLISAHNGANSNPLG